MTVFKTFFKISRKYIGNLIMYTAIFLSIVLVISNINSDTSVEDYAAATVRVAIFDEDNSELSNGLIHYLDMQHELIPIEEDLNAIRDALYVRKVEYVITIPQGFEASVFAGKEDLPLEVYKLPGSISSQFMDLSINTFLSTYCAYQAGGLTATEAYEKTLQTVTSQADVMFYAGEAASELPDVHFFYNYLPYVLICITILSIGPMLIVFNNSLMKERIHCSKLSIFKKNLSLLGASSVYTIAIVLFYFLFSLILYPGDIGGNVMFLRLLNVFIQAFVCLAFTFLFSLLTKKIAMLNMFSNVFGLSSSFLCGIFVPRELLSDSIISIGRFLPAYWYVNVENALCNLTSNAYSIVATGYLVQILYGVAVLTIALVLGQYQRRK